MQGWGNIVGILDRCSFASSVTPVSGLSLLLLVALFKVFFSRFSGFPLSSELNTSKFQFDVNYEEPPGRDVIKSMISSSRSILCSDGAFYGRNQLS